MALEPTSQERPMVEAVTLDSPATGPMRLLTVVSEKPLHVQDIERLSPAERTVDALRRRWPQAVVTELPVVLGAGGEGAD